MARQVTQAVSARPVIGSQKVLPLDRRFNIGSSPISDPCLWALTIFFNSANRSNRAEMVNLTPVSSSSVITSSLKNALSSRASIVNADTSCLLPRVDRGEGIASRIGRAPIGERPSLHFYGLDQIRNRRSYAKKRQMSFAGPGEIPERPSSSGDYVACPHISVKKNVLF